MNTKKLFYILGVICIIASAAMYFIGKENSNLTELYDMWWIPLPIAALALIVAATKK